MYAQLSLVLLCLLGKLYQVPLAETPNPSATGCTLPAESKFEACDFNLLIGDTQGHSLSHWPSHSLCAAACVCRATHRQRPRSSGLHTRDAETCQSDTTSSREHQLSSKHSRFPAHTSRSTGTHPVCMSLLTAWPCWLLLTATAPGDHALPPTRLKPTDCLYSDGHKAQYCLGIRPRESMMTL